ncbi:MAG: carboxypeptidase-like regulatory domain-containing protein [Flammeovirgaceae bacterium]|nr:carboxypeptidase-like regulatory domain-containing protein [Flammeovirgaceae bacterium]
MKNLLFILAALIGTGAWAQNITLSGKAIDRENKEPLVFASIGIKGKSLGTVTNLQGDFDFHFPNENKNDILVISMIGYKNYEAPIWSLSLDQKNTFELDKSTTLLNEVVIADSMSGNEILALAWAKIDRNFPNKPFALEGFYRDMKKVGGTYFSLLEAAVKVFDEDYAEPRNKFKLRERVKLIEVRKSLGYESRFTSFFDQRNLLEDMLLHNCIRYRQLIPEDGIFYKMNREKDSYYNGHEVYVITHTKHFSMKIFIDKTDFSIIHLEHDEKLPLPVRATESKRKNLLSRFQGAVKVIDFKKFEGKMYLNYMTVTSKVNWYDINTNELKFETELIQQLVVNHVYPNYNERIGATEKMRDYSLQYQNREYNKEFWDNYNIIKESPLDEKIIADLEKVGSLQEQFEEN